MPDQNNGAPALAFTVESTLKADKILAKKRQEQFRGELMLQISAGRFFRASIAINEHIHRHAVYSNGWLIESATVELPVGTINGSTGVQDISTIMIEAVDRLEAQRPDGTDEFMVATGGYELVDDIAYVMSFVLNRTFSRNHDEVRRLVSRGSRVGRHGSAASLFPGLFNPQQVIQPSHMDEVKRFMDELIALGREEFARVMRVIRNTVDATRRAIDDSTGAYTDFVAALESLGDERLTTLADWDRYEGRKRKIIDAALRGQEESLADKVRVAVLEADRVGLKRRFVSSTLARVSSAYYRGEAAGKVRPPRSPDLERLLGVAYDIRSKRSHVLEDLGEEAWVFTDGAETVFEPNFSRILTLAGLWRLVRHVVRQFVADAPKTAPEPWDYRKALPGIIQAQLAPQYWVWQAGGFDSKTAERWFNGVAEALIAHIAGDTKEGINLSQVIDKIEKIAPNLPKGDPKTAMVAIYALWHEWVAPKDRSPNAAVFLDSHQECLEAPSPTAFTLGLLSNRGLPDWSADEWAGLATTRRTARIKGKEAPLPAAVDALLQLETADQLEAVGRHAEAVAFASNAVEELPGHEELLTWEKRLVAGDHDPAFDVHKFLFGKEPGGVPAKEEPTAESEETSTLAEPQQEYRA
ncbi:hypothetical protein ACIBF5_09965 [Micromonospora sp. NPDC050417]|uniref:hypothetical protein n=1 Tax=Micromonospora sp. NPDC050417 TaxID=3364280 RepID=UPI003795F465